MIKIHVDGTSLEAPDGTVPVPAQGADSATSTWDGVRDQGDSP
ncbi:hypothetical protein [Catenuloplanes indicus]|uniref:Uncharacterized protein n=1 Tax=Catenuloplanes indicus TaxID=137267 RepID=A0AAE3VTM8_9ACTN|nr:hypothetical protein [Catenuloplanes indicus]MDQ0363621.1 hypothetical protein [Catenuloplanes indicus]